MGRPRTSASTAAVVATMKLPGAPAVVDGAVDFRGRVVAVVDGGHAGACLVASRC